VDGDPRESRCPAVVPGRRPRRAPPHGHDAEDQEDPGPAGGDAEGRWRRDGQPENEQAEPWTEGASERTSARVDPRPQNSRAEQEPGAGGQEAGAYRRKGTAEAEMAQGERGNNFDQAHASQGQLPRAVVDQREPQGRPLAEHGGGDRDRESGERRR